MNDQAATTTTIEKRRNEKKNVCEQCAPCENDELTLDELYYCRCDEHMYKLAHKIVVGVRIVVNRIGWRFECGACLNPIVTNSVSNHIALAPCTLHSTQPEHRLDGCVFARSMRATGNLLCSRFIYIGTS